jgi:hypothetical protein
LGTNSNGKNNRRSGLNSERKEIIKRRISEKFYDREEVLMEVAKRILQSHDLDNFPNTNGRFLN